MSLKLEYAIDINATPDAIWAVFEQIEQWPRWDSDALKNVQWVSGEPWTKGARFEMQITKPMAFTLTPEIMEIVLPVYVHLKGSGSGVIGEQHYIFKWNPETFATELRTLQEFSGMPIIFMGSKVKQPILDGIAHLFGRIKQEAEAAQPPTVQTLPQSETIAPPYDLQPETVGVNATQPPELPLQLDQPQPEPDTPLAGSS